MDDIKAKRGGKYDRSHVEGFADMRESDYNNPRYLEEIGAIPMGSKQFLDEKQAQDAAKLREQALRKMLEMQGNLPGKGGETEINRNLSEKVGALPIQIKRSLAQQIADMKKNQNVIDIDDNGNPVIEESDSESEFSDDEIGDEEKHQKFNNTLKMLGYK